MAAAAASTEGMVPITRAYLSSYYDKYPFLPPVSSRISPLTNEIRSMANDLQNGDGYPPLSPGEILIAREAESEAPHKMDENMWKNREQIEEIISLLEAKNWPKAVQEDSEFASLLGTFKEKFENTIKALEAFQTKNSDFIFNTVMTYMPQDFRGTLIRQQRERSERNKQGEVDGLIKNGGSIRDKYALLWNQQMERRRQLAQLGSATGVYKTLVKYLVGVPEVLLDFVRQINDDQGPMEEQRERYGPALYSLTTMVVNIRYYLSLLWERFQLKKTLEKHEISILEEAVDVYTCEFERYIKFLGEVFANAPFLIKAEDDASSVNDDFKELSVGAGKTFEVSFMVESVNSYIAWDFRVMQGKMSMDIGFSMELTDDGGQNTQILPYRRYESDQGNFCTCMPGNYKLIWDNSYSTFFKKVMRYKVDCIPPVVEPIKADDEQE